MISPKIYHKQIEDLHIDGMIIYPKSSDDATNLMESLIIIEKSLDHIRYNIRMDIRVIRRDYIEKIKKLDSYNLSKNKMKKKKKLINERDYKIAPYKSIEYIIEDYLKQIKNAKKYLDLNY